MAEAQKGWVMQPAATVQSEEQLGLLLDSLVVLAVVADIRKRLMLTSVQAIFHGVAR